MIAHNVRVFSSKQTPAKEDQLAWKLASLAADRVELDQDVKDMVVNRIIDNMGVAVASLARKPVRVARTQALAFPKDGGSTLIGLPNNQRYHCNWAGWANAVAVRELDFHDSFFGREFSHPADCISPITAVAQQMDCCGADLINGIATSYEIQVNLAKGMSLNSHNIDHVGHLAPAITGGIGAMLHLDADVIYQAIQQAVHTCYSTRQSRRGMLSSWKAYACAHAGKMAMESIDRAMRGETSPSPIYEGEVSVIASMLDGPKASYEVSLPAAGEPKRAIMETFTKEHSAAYHGQAMIDLAFKMRDKITDTMQIEEVVLKTKHYTHRVTGSGANDPQKMDPNATRETLDHSVMFMFAIALEDGIWHHDHSYDKVRISRPDTVALWQKVRTEEDPEWNRRYEDAPTYLERSHGGEAVITMKGGSVVRDEIHVANAHPSGLVPFTRTNYVEKFNTLAMNLADAKERNRFIEFCERLDTAGSVRELNVVVDGALFSDDDLIDGIF